MTQTTVRCHCGGELQNKSHFSAGQLDFRQCVSCGAIARVPMPTEVELDQVYSAMYGGSKIADHATNQESGDYALSRYADYFCKGLAAPGSSVLDVGAGTGAFVEQLRSRGIAAEGIERAAHAREWCSAHRGITLHADLSDLGDRRFDCCSLIEVIEHLTQPREALEAVRDRLKPGGILFLTTPNLDGLRARIEGGNWREIEKRFHVIMYSARSLVTLLTMTGYIDIRRIRFSPIQRPGFLRNVFMRAQQLLGVGGTLCYVARRK